MNKSSPIPLKRPILVNNHKITHLVIGRHYLEKHANYMNDAIIENLVMALDGKEFEIDSVTKDVEYFVSDIELSQKKKKLIYRLVWLFEGNYLEIIGIINAYRVRKRKNP